MSKKPENFQILTPRDHVRSRIGMYLGSPSVTEVERIVMGVNRKITYVPAINKAIDEIIDNSVDEAIRTGFKFANKISIRVDGNSVTVEDNGRGIPHDKVQDVNTGAMLVRPEAAWTLVNAGTSFTDDRETIGANGVGSSCVNFISANFKGETWRDGKMIIVECSDGCNSKSVREIGKVGKPGTRVTFTIDFDLFESDSLDQHDTITLLEDRVVSLQISFPEIEFIYNGKPVAVKTVKDLAKQASIADDALLVYGKGDVSFMVAPSGDSGFVHSSFVNGVHTRLGGSYVEYVSTCIAENVVALVKKKHKVDVTKALVKDGLLLIIYARGFQNPKFDSQTKERLASTNGTVMSHYKAANGIDLLTVAKQIMNTPAIIDPIIEAQLAKKLAAERRAETLAAKKIRKVKVAKHIAATGKDARLLIVEGDSACSNIINVRNPEKTGAFPLRGVIPNTWDKKPVDVLQNKELSELIAILGLDVRDKDSWKDMTYGTVTIFTDADADGAGHISPLIVCFFYRFWPGLIENGKLSILLSPIQISSKGNKSEWSYDYESAEQFKAKQPTWDHRYIKGLAQLTEAEFDVVINKPKEQFVTVDDVDFMQIMFEGGDHRKQFLMS